jgi:RHS repeat-associated protein
MPFGGKRGQGAGITASNYLFTDQELDKESGLYNYDARMYDPIASSFISPDPIIQDVYDPQYLNRFSYTRNNPLRYTDPTGNSTVAPNIGAIGGPPYYEPPAFTEMRVKSTVQTFKAINSFLDKIAFELRKFVDRKFAEEVAKTEGKRRKNRIPDIGEPGTIQSNKPGTTKKKYGEDGWVEKEFNKGHGPKAPETEQNDHIHDHEPNPHNPTGRPTRKEGRKPTPEELEEFGEVDSGATDTDGRDNSENGNGEPSNDETDSI